MNTLICLVGLAGSPPTASLSCPEPIAAKGEVKGGAALVHTFELTNRSAGTLAITRVEGSCGCIRRSLTRDVLRPSETARLSLEVNTLTQPSGLNRWQAVVGYKIESPGTQPEAGELVLQMTATLVQELIVSPPQLAFSTTGCATQTLTVADLRSNPLTILKAATTSPHLIAELGDRKPRPQGGFQQEVTIRLSPNAPQGRTDETVMLTTSDLGYPELRVPVRVEKRGTSGVVVAPEAVTVRFGSDLTEVATLVQLRRVDGKPLSIVAAVGDNPGVTVKASQGASTIATVRVTFSGSLAPQPGSCSVKVKLDVGEEVTIPVRWLGTKK